MDENLPNEQPKPGMEGFKDYVDGRRKGGTGNELSPTLLEAFSDFIRRTSVREFSRNLRSMILEFATGDDAFTALYWEDLLFDLAGLYHLLDAIEDTVRDTDEEVPVIGAVMEAFMVFVCHTPARRFSRNLRSMILEFSTTDDAGSAPYWKDLFLDLSSLFRLLDVIEVEGRELPEGRFDK